MQGLDQNLAGHRRLPGPLGGGRRADPVPAEEVERLRTIWGLMEHDLHHGGELSFVLGALGLPAPDLLTRDPPFSASTRYWRIKRMTGMAERIGAGPARRKKHGDNVAHRAVAAVRRRHRYARKRPGGLPRPRCGPSASGPTRRTSPLPRGSPGVRGVLVSRLSYALLARPVSLRLPGGGIRAPRALYLGWS